MENLLLFPSPSTPFIFGNAANGELLILGKSDPSDVMALVLPTEKWINHFIKNTNLNLALHLDLNYLSNPSSLMITGILRLISRMPERNRATVKWYYNNDDDDMKEEGEDNQGWVKCPLQLVENYDKSSISVAKTDFSPLIYIDTNGDFILHGNGLLETPLVFYRPVLRWLSDRLLDKSLKNLTLDMHLNSIDEVNLVFIQAVLWLVESLNINGCKTQILWNYSNPKVEQIGEECLANLSLHYSFNRV